MPILDSLNTSKADESHKSQTEVVCTAADILVHLTYLGFDKFLAEVH